ARVVPARAAPRRARGRAQPRRGARTREASAPAAHRLRGHGPARRAPHGARDERRRPRARARLRTQDRRGDAGRGAVEPGCHRGLSGDRSVTALLELRDVEARYGPVTALHGVSLDVGEGEVVAVLGANGAGKTTTLRAVSGTVRRTGEIRFAGKKLRTPESGARAGIAHVPEGRGTFTALTVWENLRLGAYTRRVSPKED